MGYEGKSTPGRKRPNRFLSEIQVRHSGCTGDWGLALSRTFTVEVNPGKNDPL